MRRRTTARPQDSTIEAVIQPLIEGLGATRSPDAPVRGCGSTWTVDARCGEGALWYLPINGVAAVVCLTLRAAREVSLATDAPDFVCLGSFERRPAPPRADGDAPGDVRVRRALLGCAWRGGVLRGSLASGETLRLTSIYLTPEAITTIAGSAQAKPDELTGAIALLDGTRRPPHLAELLDDVRERRLAPGCAEAYYRCKTVEACLYLIDWLRQSDAGAHPTMAAEDLTALNIARSWAEAHLHEAICLEDLCRAACVSPAKLATLFRALDNTTPMEWVRARRMDRACELLTTSTEPLGTIAALAGFAKHGSFSTAFKVRYGLTPSQYRALYRVGGGSKLTGTLLDQ